MESMEKKKRIIITTIIVLGVIVVAVGVHCFLNKDKWFSKEKPVTDIVENGDLVEFNVDRKFYLYEENPLSEESKDVKPLKEVEVVIQGTANSKTEEFDGEISVEGFELGGNTQSYSFIKRPEKEKYRYTIVASGCNVQNLESVEGPLYYYDITVSKDLKQIKIWIISRDDEWHWAVNDGY